MNEESRPVGGALQSAMSALVRDALAVGADGTLPPNQHYLQEYGLGAGTLQRAVDQLRRRKAMRTVSHGRSGRAVAELDVAAAWAAGELSPIRMVLPPEGPVEITALEEVVAEALTSMAIPHLVTHLRGGSIRRRMLLDGRADLAIFSICVLGSRPSPLLHRALGVGTYYGPSRIAVVSRAGARASERRRIGIDEDSPDHVALSHGEFPPVEGYEYVPVPFPHVPAAVLRGDIDAGIWHIIPSVVPLGMTGLQLRPLSTPGGRRAWEQTSEAVLAAGPSRPELASVVAQLDLRVLADRQRSAISADTGLVPV